MSWLHIVFGFSGHVLLSSALACRALRDRRMTARARAIVALAAAAVMFVPVGDLLIVEFMRGVFGDLSITSQILLGVSVTAYVTDRKLIGERDFKSIMITLAAVAVFFYPLALGLTYFDPYAPGFGSPYFTTALLLATLAAWWFRLNWLVACIVLALAGYLLRVLESDNLWDYLIDSVVAIYSIWWVSARLFNRLIHVAQRRRGSFPVLSRFSISPKRKDARIRR